MNHRHYSQPTDMHVKPHVQCSVVIETDMYTDTQLDQETNKYCQPTLVTSETGLIMRSLEESLS